MLSPFSFVFFDEHGTHYACPYSPDDFHHNGKLPKFYDESDFNDGDF